MAIPTAFRPLGGVKQSALPGYTVFPRDDFSFTWLERPADTEVGTTWPNLNWNNLTFDNIKTCFELLGILDPAEVTTTANYAFNNQGTADANTQVAIAQIGSLPALAITGRGRLSLDSCFVAKVYGYDVDSANGWGTGNAGKILKVNIEYERSNTDTDSWIGVYAYGSSSFVQLSAIRNNDLRKDGPVTLEIPAATVEPTLSTCDGVILFVRDASTGNTIYVTRLRVWFE